MSSPFTARTTTATSTWRAFARASCWPACRAPARRGPPPAAPRRANPGPRPLPATPRKPQIIEGQLATHRKERGAAVRLTTGHWHSPKYLINFICARVSLANGCPLLRSTSHTPTHRQTNKTRVPYSHQRPPVSGFPMPHHNNTCNNRYCTVSKVKQPIFFK